MSLKSAAALSMVALFVAAGAARADIVHFAATLTGKDEVPANASAGTGQVTAELETTERTLAYRATYQGLSGPATMAHFHGPAAAGANAPPVVVVGDNAKLPIGGSVRLTEQEMEDLLAGKWYFNVHTAANPGGEVRGQLKEIGR
ncbi:MAG: CHRD domain-containing protein [Phenylobacterium sp.]